MLARLTFLIRTIVASIVTPIAQFTLQLYVTYLFIFRLFLFLQISLLIRGEYKITGQDYIDWLIFKSVICNQGLRILFSDWHDLQITSITMPLSYNMKGIVLCIIIFSDACLLVMMYVELMMLNDIECIYRWRSVTYISNILHVNARCDIQDLVLV